MNKRKVRLSDTKITGSSHGSNTLRVEVYYDMGGMNYFTGKSHPRGYRVSVVPVEVRENSVSFRAFSGGFNMLEEADRFSAKRLEQLALEVKDGKINIGPLKAYVLAENGLTEVEGTTVYFPRGNP